MRVIGIDPGTINLGFGIIDIKGNSISPVHFGTIKANQKDSIAVRLSTIMLELQDILDLYRPNEGSVEKAFVGKNIHSALRLGEGRGAAIASLGIFGMPVSEYSPLEVKKAVVGSAPASKQQVRMMVKVILNIREPFESDDTSDALAVAICHSHRYKSQRLFQ